ncbi:hypothetical protein HTSR_1318 [Halodesulfurarchaeum formicicum]|uniref:Uncharacterized protein n=1 Tax=Halodesulfurarchaeum formicicum TaxID=1873524 RepID=A0A1D8S576_9EURY|nr:DUF5787 family protein [Halodesulfurarchaeum formicicum]AOW80495.1 hypothetical protein HTSR_1318 [Halodesulfurarchaeum formicicum]
MSFPPGDSEFAFELASCAWAEQEWPPTGEPTPAIVARQLGWQQRRWDTIVIEVEPDAFETRAAFGPERLNSDLRHVLQHAPESWTYYREALPHPGYPWRYVRESIHEATARDALESRKRGGQIEIRRVEKYPDWVDRIIAIENKPDLDASAARRLTDQLERDVAAGIADEVWLATTGTDSRVEPALLERIPSEVGILTLGPEGVDVRWRPRTLDTEQAGIDILDRSEGGSHDQSAAQFEVLSRAAKSEKRYDIAERAYERGWRHYVESMRPDCAHFDLTVGRYGYRPTCTAFDRTQTPRECRGSCPHFQPEPPQHRQGGWPIEGGPGQTVKRILRERSARRHSVSSTVTSDRGTASR